MQLKLITPEKTLFEGEIQQVQVPGTEGDFGVLPGHAPFISTIRAGFVTIDTAGATTRIAVVGGIAEVTPHQTIVLAERAQDVTGMADSEMEAVLAKLAA